MVGIRACVMWKGRLPSRCFRPADPPPGTVSQLLGGMWLRVQPNCNQAEELRSCWLGKVEQGGRGGTCWELREGALTPFWPGAGGRSHECASVDGGRDRLKKYFYVLT